MSLKRTTQIGHLVNRALPFRSEITPSFMVYRRVRSVFPVPTFARLRMCVCKRSLQGQLTPTNLPLSYPPPSSHLPILHVLRSRVTSSSSLAPPTSPSLPSSSSSPKMNLLLAAVLLVLVTIFVANLDANVSLYLFDLSSTLLSSSSSSLSSSSSSSFSRSHFSGKKVWVTGASSGIGLELSLQLCRSGALVVASARTSKALNDAKDTCKGPGEIHVLTLDVLADEDTLREKTKQALGMLGGGIDILVLNAGRSQRQVAVDAPLSTTEELMRLNFFSLVSLTRVVLQESKWLDPSSPSFGGHIVVTSSIAGKLPVALSTSYAASKAAANAYFAGLRSELPALRVDLVCPGPVATAIAVSAHGNSDDGGRQREQGGDGEKASGGAAAETGDKKMSVERCAGLMLSAMRGPGFLFYETWISGNPELIFTYVGQYLTGVTHMLGKVVGPKRIEAFKSGKDIYNMKSWGVDKK